MGLQQRNQAVTSSTSPTLFLAGPQLLHGNLRQLPRFVRHRYKSGFLLLHTHMRGEQRYVNTMKIINEIVKKESFVPIAVQPLPWLKQALQTVPCRRLFSVQNGRPALVG